MNTSSQTLNPPPRMSWPVTLFIALLIGIIGLLISVFVTDCYLTWYHRPNDLGASLLVIVNAVVGGILSCVIGMVCARVWGPGILKAFAYSSGIVLGINGVIALGLYLCADITPTIGGDELMLELEIKLPVGHTKPVGEGTFTLNSVRDGAQWGSQTGELKVDAARQEQDRWIVPAEAKVFTSRGLRTTNATLGEEDIGGFVVPLPGHPGKAYQEWSPWYPQPRSGEPAWPDSKSSFRFRVSRIPPPPPPPTTEEWMAQNEDKEQAKFDSIAADAPLTEWLPYTEPHITEKRRVVALERIISKPTFVAELSALMLTDGAYEEAPRLAASALFLVSRIEKPTADLIPGVTAAGRDIIARIRKFNASTPEQDPGYEGAADISIRFVAWTEAVRALREKAGGVFIPELREILELSRLRSDSRAMQGDVCRVASFYLKEWAGVEPLPSDPSPR